MARGCLIVLVALSISCRLADSTMPPLAGPSSLGLSLTITASPDTLAEDGRSQSIVSIEARDAAGRTVSNLSFAVDLESDEPFNLGRISARTVVTDLSGRAVVIYTAPPRVSTNHAGRVVVLAFTPVGTDFGSQTMRRVQIRLRPV